MGLDAPVPLSKGGEAEEIVCGVAYIVDNFDGLAGETGGVQVFEGGKWCSNDPPSFIHNALQGFPVLVSAASTRNTDAVGEDALNGSSVKGGHDGTIACLSLCRK